MLRFTIRDLLWLTLVVALVTAWWLQGLVWRRQMQALAIKHEKVVINEGKLKSQIADLVAKKIGPRLPLSPNRLAVFRRRDQDEGPTQVVPLK